MRPSSAPWRTRLAGLVLVAVLGLPASASAGIDVRVRGLGSDERDNVYATLGILEYARRIDAARNQAKEQAGTRKPAAGADRPAAADSVTETLDTEYDAAEVQRLYEQGPADIVKALQPYGWYQPKVKSTIENEGADWIVTYDVTALPQTTVTKVDVAIVGEGHDFPALTRFQSHTWPLRAGERLKHENYETLKARLLAAAQSNGFLDAQFSRRELRVDLDAGTAVAALTLDTGPRYFFGDFVIEQAMDGPADGAAPAGRPKLKDSMLRRYVRIVPGQPYEQQKVLDTQFSLSDLGYFQSVEIEPHRDRIDAGHRVPLTLHTRPRRSRVYKYGVGYGTDTGARALAGVEFRRLNDDGHKLKIEVRPSQIDSSGVAEYLIPVGHNAADSVSLLGKLQNITLQDGKERVATAETALNRTYGRLTRRLYLDYIVDDFNFNDSSNVHSILLTPGVSFNYLDLDDPILARRGFSAFLDLHGSAENVISDTQFLSTRLQLKGVLPLDDLWSAAPRRKYRLLGRVEQGLIVSNGFGQLPPSQRFFAGGDDSVRGYAYQSLGPKNANGKVIGGRYLTVVSGEIEYALTQAWAVASFVDAGGADDVPQVGLHCGAGLGVRYRAPFGSIAVDLAHPFDRDQSPVRLHLGVRVGL